MILGDLVKRNAKRYPHKTSLVFGAARFTFDESNRRINSMANALLDLGLQRQDRVAILLDNCHQYIELYYAIPEAGGIVVPLNIALSATELAYIINDAGAKILVFGERLAPLVDSLLPQLSAVKTTVIVGAPAKDACSYEQLVTRYPATAPQVAVNEQDTACLLYTSGTTGMPKGVMHTHRSIIENGLNFIIGYHVNHDDIGLVVSPLFWGSGLVVNIIPQCYTGGTLVIAENVTPEAILDVIQQEKVTSTFLTPPAITVILEHPQLGKHDLTRLRHVSFAGMPMPVDTLKRAIETVGNIFFQCYGMTESPCIAMIYHEDQVIEGSPEKVNRLSSCGREDPNVELRVVDEDGRDVPPGQVGEIISRGEHLMKGYWRMPQATAEALRDGYMHTGDLATIDEDGYIYLVGRKKDLIVSGGQTVYALAIEEVLYQHPWVAEAAVIGVPDPKLGEAVKAVVVARQGNQVTAAEIIDFCRQRLPEYACPHSVVFREKLPRSASGKILKRMLQ